MDGRSADPPPSGLRRPAGRPAGVDPGRKHRDGEDGPRDHPRRDAFLTPQAPAKRRRPQASPGLVGGGVSVRQEGSDRLGQAEQPGEGRRVGLHGRAPVEAIRRVPPACGGMADTASGHRRRPSPGPWPPRRGCQSRPRSGRCHRAGVAPYHPGQGSGKRSRNCTIRRICPSLASASNFANRANIARRSQLARPSPGCIRPIPHGPSGSRLEPKSHLQNLQIPTIGPPGRLLRVL